LERLDERPFPPGDYDVVVVGSGPGGLQIAYSLARTGIPRCAVISRDAAPGGMFRRFPVYQRLISWTKPDAPFERGTREYEWYDHNSLIGDERQHQALAPEFMDRTFDVPSRPEMEAALVGFATRGGVRVRYGCEWLSTRRDDEGFVLGTSDGEYRCRVCVFAIGVTEPWVAPIPGLEAAPHYVAANAPERYQGKSVFIVGKRNSGFELAHGLLPWARRIVLGSPRPVDTAMLAFSPLSIRYLSPYTEHIRGGTGSYVVDAAIERVERQEEGYRIHAVGTTWEGELELETDEVIAATGFRAPVRDLPDIGVAMVNDDRMPAQTPYFESISVPGIYFAGNVTQASPGLRKHGATSTSGSVNGFRYNARVLAHYIAEKHFGLGRERRRLHDDEVLPYLLAELAHAPELWTQKGYLARVVGVDGADGCRDEGIVPLADFLDRDGGDACAVAVEYDADGTIIPVVYIRGGGRLVESSLAPHPLHTFDTDEHRRQLAACLALLQSPGRSRQGSDKEQAARRAGTTAGWA
jgi:thioredoxin reductase